MISIIIALIPFLFALFARQNPSKNLVFFASIISCLLINIGITIYERINYVSLSNEFLGGLMGTALGKSVPGILAALLFIYIFRKFLK